MKRTATKHNDAKYWIEKLRLERHPEGGYFRQTYKSALRIVPEPPRSQPPEENAGRVGQTQTRVEQPSRVGESKIPTLAAKTAARVGHPARRVGQSGLSGFSGPRAASTAIYFLLGGEDFSAFHRLRSDEMWHFYAGSALVVHVIDAAGEYSSVLLGNDPERGEVFQAVVKAGCWFASEVARDSHVSQKRRDMGHPTYALVGCTVAPGFEFEDFELAKREELVRQFPKHRKLIEKLTRE